MTQLSLEVLIDTSELINRQFLPTDALLMVGKNVEAWLKMLLDSLQVGESPVILGQVSPSAVLEGRVFVAPGATVEPHAFVQGPCYIGPNAEVRHAAYIRGNVYIGARAVVGHTTEVKSSTFLDDAKAGHFAYVGDSLLGRHVNLGAGTKLANLKIRGNEVRIKHPLSGKIESTQMRKLGSLLGDNAQTGCNAVLSPGSILMPGTHVLPCEHFLGTKFSNPSPK
jgi:UDP-N-acetylglucosamine diphosphorylase / glucose-1-phosphate thymidylyltransferase / UDP-N-acetylgalactosamine diphosphorylase / glucosamine-1-phosphate N-acetyltransferase / galactosamine-1-phosphate N-acetyltransferase